MPANSAQTPWTERVTPNVLAKDLDGRTFPLLRDYLGRLPNGLHSYPECRVNSDFFSHLQAHQPHLWADPRLPAPLREALSQRPPAGAFMSTVLSFCQSIVWRDLEAVGENAYLHKALQVMWTVLSGPMYRASLHFLSPNIVLLNAGKRWSAFVEGAELLSVGGTKSTHTLRLVAPPGLYPLISLRFYAANFEELLRRTHARRPQVDFERATDTETLFKLRWDA